MSVQKTVYFVRHGQSEGNVGTTYQPVHSPLTGKGKRQSMFLAKRACHLPFETIISSPQVRAKDTAGIIANATSRSVEFSDLFLERKKPSALNDKAHEDPEAEALNTDWEKSLYTPGYRAQDGENFDDLAVRSKEALQYLADRPETSLLVVTHGFFLRTIVAFVLLGDKLDGDSFKHFQWRIRTENTGLSVLGFDSKLSDPAWRLLVWNDQAHLAEV